ncbi:MAG: hypothetical protein JSV43_06865, partial [Methanobacteriota archaeon]
MKRYLAPIIAVLMLISLVPLFQGTVAQDSEVRVFVVGPEAIEVGKKAVYNVTVVGGPAEEEGGKWQVAAVLTGANVSEETGASPTLASKFNETQDSNIFLINVSAPSIAQHMVLNIEAFSHHGAETVLTNETFDIFVVHPINLRATVSNPSNSTLKNVLVNFYVDGEFVGGTSIEEISPFSEGAATLKWITKDVSPGRHIMTVEIDLDGDGTIEERFGDTLYVGNFYSPRGDPGLVVIILIII